jgi:hypothetical protein
LSSKDFFFVSGAEEDTFLGYNCKDDRARAVSFERMAVNTGHGQDTDGTRTGHGLLSTVKEKLIT